MKTRRNGHVAREFVTRDKERDRGAATVSVSRNKGKRGGWCRVGLAVLRFSQSIDRLVGRIRTPCRPSRQNQLFNASER